jgi:hypothetical protein
MRRVFPLIRQGFPVSLPKFPAKILKKIKKIYKKVLTKKGDICDNELHSTIYPNFISWTEGILWLKDRAQG